MAISFSANGTNLMPYLAPGGLQIATESRGYREVKYLDGSLGVSRRAEKIKITAETRLLTETELQTVKTALNGLIVSISYAAEGESPRSNVPMKKDDMPVSVKNYGGTDWYGPLKIVLTEVG